MPNEVTKKYNTLDLCCPLAGMISAVKGPPAQFSGPLAPPQGGHTDKQTDRQTEKHV